MLQLRKGKLLPNPAGPRRFFRRLDTTGGVDSLIEAWQRFFPQMSSARSSLVDVGWMRCSSNHVCCFNFCEGVDHCSKFFFRDLKVTSLQALTQRLELAVAELKGRQDFACHFKQVR